MRRRFPPRQGFCARGSRPWSLFARTRWGIRTATIYKAFANVALREEGPAHEAPLPSSTGVYAKGSRPQSLVARENAEAYEANATLLDGEKGFADGDAASLPDAGATPLDGEPLVGDESQCRSRGLARWEEGICLRGATSLPTPQATQDESGKKGHA